MIYSELERCVLLNELSTVVDRLPILFICDFGVCVRTTDRTRFPTTNFDEFI